MKQVDHFDKKIIDFSTWFSKIQDFLTKEVDALLFSGYTDWGLFFRMTVKQKIFVKLNARGRSKNAAFSYFGHQNWSYERIFIIIILKQNF